MRRAHDDETIRATKTTREQLAVKATEIMLGLHEQLTVANGTQATIRGLLAAAAGLSSALAHALQAARIFADGPTLPNERAFTLALGQLEEKARRDLRKALRDMSEGIDALANVARMPKCYACDAMAVGVRDRRPEGQLEHACKRHMEHR